jgi:hypothetical protein
MDALSAMELIKSRRAVADPDAFYIRPRIFGFAQAWQALLTGAG